MSFGNDSDRPWVLDEDAGRAHRAGGRRRRRHLLRHGRHLLRWSQRGGHRPPAPKFLSRDEMVVATKVFMPMTPGENGGGLSRKHILSAIDASLDPPGHGLRRPLPDPPVGSPNSHRGDHGGAPRRGPGGQGPLHRGQQHVRLAVRQGPARGRRQPLDPLRVHAAPLQPHLPGGGAGDDPPVHRPGRRDHPLEPAGAWGVWPATGPGPASDGPPGRTPTPSPTTSTASPPTSTSSSGWPRWPPIATCRPPRSPWPGSSSRPGVTAPIIGATKPHHLTDALAAEQLELTDEEAARLEEPYVPHPVLGHF